MSRLTNRLLCNWISRRNLQELDTTAASDRRGCKVRRHSPPLYPIPPSSFQLWISQGPRVWRAGYYNNNWNRTLGFGRRRYSWLFSDSWAFCFQMVFCNAGDHRRSVQTAGEPVSHAENLHPGKFIGLDYDEWPKSRFICVYCIIFKIF